MDRFQLPQVFTATTKRQITFNNSVHRNFWYQFYVLYFFPARGNRTWPLSSRLKTDQADYTDWMPFQPSNFMGKSGLIQKPQAQIPEAFQQHDIAEKIKDNLGINALR